MKTFGIILIIAGIAMLVFRGFNIKTEEKVLDIGPVEVNKEENRWLSWPTYAGVIAIVAGIVVIAANGKKKVA